MEDTAREFDALCGEVGLLLEDLLADVLERDLGRGEVFREAVHGGRGWRGNEGGRETYKLFSEEAEPEKEGAGYVIRICECVWERTDLHTHQR